MKNSSIREKTHKGVDNIMDRAENIGEKGKEQVDKLKEKGTLARKNVDGYIQKNPEKSVLIAAGVGIATGAILTGILMRKRKRQS